MSPAFEKWMITRGRATRRPVPHGHPIVPGNRIPGVPLADVEVGADVEILRFENEAEDLLHYLKRPGFRPGLTGKLDASDDDEVALGATVERIAVTRSVAETVSVKRRPVAAAAHRAARAARARQGPLRPLKSGEGRGPRIAPMEASRISRTTGGDRQTGIT